MKSFPFKTVQKSWGREEFYFGGAFSRYWVKKLIYLHKISSSLHYHPYKHETFCVLKGSFKLEVGVPGAAREGTSSTHILHSGDVFVLPPSTRHRLRLTSKPPGVVLECCDRDDPEDCVRIEPSEQP